MTTKNWKPYLKLGANGFPCMAQQTYEPLVSPDGDTFCKNYNFPNNYQYLETKDRPLYTQEVVDWFFQNEVRWIEYFKNKPYSPEIIDIDFKRKKIFLKWYKESCNQVMFSGRSWPTEWLDKIKNIILDQYATGVYKLTMYPHCHYIDSHDNMRAIDWYGCVLVANPYIEEKYMQGIIHETAQFRLDETGSAIDNKLNLEIMFKRSLGQHVMWGEQNMSYIYKELFDA
jgi:hypothetical protein